MTPLGLTYKEFAERVGATYGSVKRWVSEGLPVDRTRETPRIHPAAGMRWLDEHPRRSVAFDRAALVYFVRVGERVKIGYTSDVDRRLYEVGPKVGARAELLATLPGDKRTELALHKRFEGFALGEEWFSFRGELRTFVDLLRGAA